MGGAFAAVSRSNRSAIKTKFTHIPSEDQKKKTIIAQSVLTSVGISDLLELPDTFASKSKLFFGVGVANL